MNLISDCESLKFESSLLLSIFVERFDDIESIEVRKLLCRNKSRLLKAVNLVDFERFDQRFEYGVSPDQLKFLISKLPVVVQ